MKRNYVLITSALLISLFIYMFYRTEKTVINELFLALIPLKKFIELRSNITAALPLNEFVIFSLPEGLWVFCISLASKNFFVKLGRLEISLLPVPLLVAVSLEFFQLMQFTNGRFDFWDIWASVFFWVIANYGLNNSLQRQNVFTPFNTRSAVCVLSYLVVYLAHVWQMKTTLIWNRR